jgi:hypothetical protein
MNPNAARASVLVLSFVVLGLSGLVTSVVWSFLSPLQTLPRALVSLLVFVSAYYLGANLLFWKAILRISPSQFSQQA